jgi:hypothetical protein
VQNGGSCMAGDPLPVPDGNCSGECRHGGLSGGNPPGTARARRSPSACCCRVYEVTDACWTHCCIERLRDHEAVNFLAAVRSVAVAWARRGPYDLVGAAGDQAVLS